MGALLALSGLGLIIAAVGLAHGPDLTKTARALGWPLAYVQSAYKWSKRYGMPFDWVLNTISVESGGNPNAAGDAGGKSVGLMQVNTEAHPVTREQMRVPDLNIQWGTKLMRQFRDDLLAALGGRHPPAPLDVLTRLAYKGPSSVNAVLRRGDNPLSALSWAPEAAARWRRHMMNTQAAIKGQSFDPKRATGVA